MILIKKIVNQKIKMKKICLNFMNEKVEINLPSSLKSLKKEISKKYSISDSEIELLKIKYIKNSETKEIITENNFKNFVKNNINEISINIDEENRISEKNDNLNLRKELNELELENNKLNKEKEEILLESKKFLLQKKTKITLNKIKYNNIKNKIKSNYIEKEENINKITKKINEIKKKLNEKEIPLNQYNEFDIIEKSINNYIKKIKKSNRNLIQDSDEMDKGFKKEEDIINEEKRRIKEMNEIFPLNEIKETFDKLSHKKMTNIELNLIDIPNKIELLKKNFIEKKKNFNIDYINYNK